MLLRVFSGLKVVKLDLVVINWLYFYSKLSYVYVHFGEGLNWLIPTTSNTTVSQHSHLFSGVIFILSCLFWLKESVYISKRTIENCENVSAPGEAWHYW